MPTLTPNQAAKKLGISRRTIMRAIEQHNLHAIRDNRNQWQINDTDLAQWAPSNMPNLLPKQRPPLRTLSMKCKYVLPF